MECERDTLTRSLDDLLARCAEWPSRFSPEEWNLYRTVISEVRRSGIPFAIGGGLAGMTYAGGWRNTKDLDMYVVPRDRAKLIRLLSELGLWIYRSHQCDVIIDIIWAMANQRAHIDETWLRGPEVEVSGERFRLLAPGDSLWSKLYVLQRDRTGWPDCLNILHGVAPLMNWTRLIANVSEDLPLLAGLISAFSWIAPRRAWELPDFIWGRLGLCPPDQQVDESVVKQRAGFLEGRSWFYGLETVSRIDGSNNGC